MKLHQCLKCNNLTKNIKFCSQNCASDTQFKSGHLSWNTNKKNCFSIETIKQISEKQKGKHNSINTEFKKGMVAINKGKKLSIEQRKILSDAHYKGGYMCKGYKVVMYNNKHIKEHHLIWLQKNKLGLNYIPEGYAVHHINLNKIDNIIENLILLPKDYHDNLHWYIRKEKGDDIKCQL